jgi:hypothetical protein
VSPRRFIPTLAAIAACAVLIIGPGDPGLLGVRSAHATNASPTSTSSGTTAAGATSVTGTTTIISSTTYGETSSRISYSGTWSYAYASGYQGGRVKWSRQAGAKAVFAFSGVAVAWYGPTGSTRGKARVYLDGTYVKTVSMYSTSRVARKLLYSVTFPSNHTGHIKIVVVGTAGHPIVAIDSFTVKRATTVTSATPLGGYPTDTTLRTLATTARSRPPYLVGVLDSALGTVTTRVTSTAGVRHSYARLSAWNRDGTRILLGFTYPGRMLDGRTYADLGSFRQVSQAIWSNVDPNKLYGAMGNAVYRQNATTAAETRLHTFSGYASITIGSWEGAISDDDRWMALIGTTSTGAKHLITYDVANDAVLADLQVSSRIDNAQISRKGNYVVVVNASDGTAAGQGVERYTRDLTNRLFLTPYARHGDNALDANGNEIYVANAPYVDSFRLSDGSRTRLLAGLTAFEYGHTSGRNLDRPGWVYLSVYDNTATAGRPGHDQVVAVKTDGSGIVEVFAFEHHTNTTSYADQPQAVPSPDGTRVLFASEWGTTGAYAYVAQH